MMRVLVVGAWLLLSSGGASAQTAREFKVDDAWGRDSVQFRTTAPLEDVIGNTNEITGVVRVDPSAVKSAGTSARFEVEVATFKTGIEMRDGGVRKSLGADRFPKATLTIERVKSASAPTLAPNVPVDVVAEGTFELHGVKKTIEVPAQVTYVPSGGPFSKMRPGNFVRLTAKFEIRLADYNIDRAGPVLPLQVGETALITVSALASDASAAEAETYRQSAIKYMGKARR